MSQTPVLRVCGLKTYFHLRQRVIKAVDGVDLEAHSGRITAIVGGSGSGKSVMSLSILNLIDKPGRIMDGEVWLHGKNLLSLSDRQLRRIRGKEIAMIFQEPANSMNPVLKVKKHLYEAVHIHNQSVRLRELMDYFRDVLRRVGLKNPDKVLESYPFELSGGMCQRVMVAMGLVTKADVLIADEPTSSLDLTTQAAILEELEALKNQNMAVVLITHDLGVVAQTADYVYVFKDGQVIENGTVGDIFSRPQAAYTQKLLAAVR